MKDIVTDSGRHVMLCQRALVRCRGVAATLQDLINCNHTSFQQFLHLKCLPCVQIVIDYFNSRLDSLNSQAGAASEGQAEWSVDRVLELVQTFTQVSLRARWLEYRLSSFSANIWLSTVNAWKAAWRAWGGIEHPPAAAAPF